MSPPGILTHPPDIKAPHPLIGSSSPAMVDKSEDSEEWAYCVRPGQLIPWVHANEENLEDPHEA